MTERITIAGTKRAFHIDFPYVIPPIYRRLADELLVELHLLSCKKNFKNDSIFAIGLCQIFDTFTKGYKPENHIDKLFAALCKCNNLDSSVIRTKAKSLIESIRDKNIDYVTSCFKGIGSNIPKPLQDQINLYKIDKPIYSRISTIGLLTLFQSLNNENKEEELLLNNVKEISNYLGYSPERVEKDLGIYSVNIQKMNQAIELIEESIKSERRKKAKI